MRKLSLSVFTSTHPVRVYHQDMPLLGKSFHLDKEGHVIKLSHGALVIGLYSWLIAFSSYCDWSK